MRKKRTTDIILLAALTAICIVAAIFIGKSTKLLYVLGAYILLSSIVMLKARWIKREFITLFLTALFLFAGELFLMTKRVGMSNLTIKIATIVISLLFLLNYIGSLINFFNRKITTMRTVAMLMFTLYHVIIGYVIYVYLSFVFLI